MRWFPATSMQRIGLLRSSESGSAVHYSLFQPMCSPHPWWDIMNPEGRKLVHQGVGKWNKIGMKIINGGKIVNWACLSFSQSEETRQPTKRWFLAETIGGQMMRRVELHAPTSSCKSLSQWGQIGNIVHLKHQQIIKTIQCHDWSLGQFSEKIV